MESRRSRLLAENRQLEREKQAAFDAAVNDPGFSPTSNSAADRRAELLVMQQDAVIDEVERIDRELQS